MSSQEYKKKQIVFREGEPGDCMFFIRWGSVGVYKDYGTPRQKQLATLVQGDYFGEMGLLDGETRSATIVALDHQTVLDRIGEDEFAEFLTTNPAKVQDILAQLCHKLRHATQEYLDVCQSVHRSVGERVESVDESSDYHFSKNEQLNAIHSKVSESMDNNS